MIFVTTKQQPIYHQLTFDEYFYHTKRAIEINPNISNTRTYQCDKANEKLSNMIHVDTMIERLKYFNSVFGGLVTGDMSTKYHSFKIAKRSGGQRQIDEPLEDLRCAQNTLKRIFETDFFSLSLYHTSAFAYIKGRSTLDAVRRHQANDSKWFAKMDLSNFFGNTTKAFVMDMLSMVFPFCEVCRTPVGKSELSKALDICFLRGGLPQGSPISPLITNIMMIPIDHYISRAFNDLDVGDGKKQHFVYTRYADDFIVSSKYDFDVNKAQCVIESVLRQFNAPFSIKPEKTRYGSSAGRNFILGVMLNKDNEITIGRSRKKQFEAKLHTYAKDRLSGNRWSVGDVMELEGLISYYTMIEGDTINRIIEYIGNKNHLDIKKAIIEDKKV